LDTREGYLAALADCGSVSRFADSVQRASALKALSGFKDARRA
jgi:hypothetical protein